MGDAFTHLHVHTEYSMLDGASRLGELVAAAAATRSSTRAAPSSIEYSVWTWRCVNESPTGLLLANCSGVV